MLVVREERAPRAAADPAAAGCDGVAADCINEDGVDVSLIRWMLSLSLEERLAVLQGFVDSVAELTRDSAATEIQRGA